MILELRDPNSKPYVRPTRNYTPEQRKMIQDEVRKLVANGAIEESISEYAISWRTLR